MRELIEKQAAIDAHCELCGDRNKYFCNSDICPDVEVFQLIPSVQSDHIADTDKKVDTISRQAALDAIGNVPDHDDGMVWEALSHAQRDVALLPSTQPDVVTASLEELINDYGEDGYFVVDGVNYQANELLNELKINSFVGEKFRKQIAKTIVQYFMKFGG